MLAKKCWLFLICCSKNTNNYRIATAKTGINPPNSIWSNMDRETIIKEIRRIAAELGSNVLSKSEFESRSGISERQIYKYFDSWNEAVKAAGLTPVYVGRIDDAELFHEMKEAFVKFGGVCTRMKFGKLCKYSEKTYGRFGTWDDALSAFRVWLEKSGEQFPFLNQLPTANGQVVVKEDNLPEEKVKQVSWKPLGRVTYGPMLNFRGLQHAPVNEQGVVFLFGMICSELGFVVESVRTGYPDCKAKRRVSRNPEKWEDVKIEFEYYSSEFRSHGHNPVNCDVIVCWEHDWKECPLEVIELKKEILSLRNGISSP